MNGLGLMQNTFTLEVKKIIKSPRKTEEHIVCFGLNKKRKNTDYCRRYPLNLNTTYFPPNYNITLLEVAV